MFRMRLFITLIGGTAFLGFPGFCQNERETSRQDVSVQGFGSFVKSTTQYGIENKASNSGGVLASYRYFFSAHHGVEANYGYSSNTEKYLFSSGLTGVNTHGHEISGAYVFRYPLRKFTPFALAGAGALVFDPKDYAGASRQTRASFIYGGGADFNLTQRIFARTEYRGFLYNSPNYDLPKLASMDRVTHRAEPSIGFGYKF